MSTIFLSIITSVTCNARNNLITLYLVIHQFYKMKQRFRSDSHWLRARELFVCFSCSLLMDPIHRTVGGGGGGGGGGAVYKGVANINLVTLDL